MDDVVNRFARELADAIAAAVAENPQVEACREKARAAGFEMKVTLEAVVGFVSRSQSAALTKVTAPARVVQPRRNFEVSANDRRFLRSLRIAADETTEPVEYTGAVTTLAGASPGAPAFFYFWVATLPARAAAAAPTTADRPRRSPTPRCRPDTSPARAGCCRERR